MVNVVSANGNSHPESEKREKQNKGGSSQQNPAVDRGQWGSQLEFVLTIVGYAVGLGNVWRFPYLTFKNGGAAFLLPYFLMMLLVGIPEVFLEISFGQFASLGPLKCWNLAPIGKGIGVALCVQSLFVALTYHILLAYIIYYFIASWVAVGTGELLWSSCNNTWNTPNCFTADMQQNKSVLNITLDERGLNYTDIKTPTEEYYYNNVLKVSEGIDAPGEIVWELALCLLLAWFLVFLILIKGVKSMGKAVYFTSTFPYVMLTVMVVRGCMLDGAIDGIKFYMTGGDNFSFDKLKEPKVWSDAASQIFYSLSCSTGGLIAMASYNKFNHNVLRDAIMVPIINCLTSLYAGFAVFSILGYVAKLKNVNISEVADGGPGLVFVVYPEGLSSMPIAPLWSILFFFMMLTLGFSSAFSMVEGIFVAMLDEFESTLRKTPSRPIIFRAVGCTFCYIISLPMVTKGGFYLFNIVDSYAGGFPRLLLAMFQITCITWIYGMGKFSADIKLMIGRSPSIYFKATWVLAPFILLFIFGFRISDTQPLTLFKGTYIYPVWADVIGWLCVAFIVMWYPVFVVISWCQNGFCQVIQRSASENDSWGPALDENRRGRYANKFEAKFDSLSIIGDSMKIRGAQESTTNIDQVPSEPAPDYSIVRPTMGRFHSTNYDNGGFVTETSYF